MNKSKKSSQMKKKILGLFKRNGDSYNSLFSTQVSTKKMNVDHVIWKKLHQKLKGKYILPDPKTMEVIQSVSGDQYNRIFSIQVPVPGNLVDLEVWNQIHAALPHDYKLPDPVTMSVLSKVMKGG
jgi:hypothetical protein